MTKLVRGAWVPFAFTMWSLAAIAGCADAGNGGNPTTRDAGRPDGGPLDANTVDAGPTCMTNADCADDGQFCNGVLQCMAGRCIVANVPTCNDSVSCTNDTCDATLNRCVHTPSDLNCSGGLHCALTGCVTGVPCEFDTDCDDHVFCNGVESCVMGICNSAGMRDCDDTNSCTMDTCDEPGGTGGMCNHMAFADSMTNVAHCGSGTMCMACPAPAPTLHEVASCTAGVCGTACETGFIDLDGNMTNGCEFACTVMPGVDLPDDAFVDSNCDGIDGDRTLAIFVSTTGTPSNDGLTPTTPVGSFADAFTVQQLNPSRTQILVANGTYTTNTPVAIPSGVGIYGGYTNVFRTRADTRAQLTTSGTTVAIADHLTAPTVIDRVSLTTQSQTTPSAATTTLVVMNSGDNLTLRFMTVIAGRGGDGAAGAAGATGAVGGRGGDGSGSSRGSGGSPNGGVGGNGGGQGSTGVGGGNGTGACGGSGGSAGTGGTGCGDGDPGGGGGGGTPSCGGTAGTSGTPGDGIGTLTGSTWTPSTGGVGGTGSVGGGGGGGGGGAGEHCDVVVTCYCDTGRGGGGGGGGGAGGRGGRGGTEGGASIAIVLISSTLNVTNLRITTSAGGNGGAGGAGGVGGTGGGGGLGQGRGNTSQGPGGNGAAGSDGGDGGCGGGGGGGPSIGIWGDGNASAQINEITPTTFSIGSGGTAGASCGSSGASGTTANTRNATVL